MTLNRKLFLALLLAILVAPAAAQISITGKITDPRGQPVAKAQVLLLPASSSYEAGCLLLTGDFPQPVAQGESDGSGLFELLAPEEGMWEVRVEKQGFAPQLYPLYPLLEAIVLPPVALRRAAELEVRLRDAAGKPLVARVWGREGGKEQDRRLAAFGQTTWQLASHLGRTAEDGTLRLPLAVQQAWTLEVVAAEHVPLRAEVFGGQRRFDKKLQRGVPLALEVVEGPRGEALAEVLIYRSEWSLPTTLSDAQGRAVLHVAPGEGVEVVLLGGGGQAANRQLAAPDPKRPEAVEVEVLPEHTLSGQVVDRATGEPIAGALVWTFALEAWTATDGAGSYRLSLPPVMGWTLMAAARGHGGVRQRVEGKEQRGPTIALPPATELSGVVVDADGHGVVGVELEATKNMTRRSMASWSELGSAWHGRSGVQGQFRIGGMPLASAYELELRKPGYATSKVKVAELTIPRHDLRLVLARGIRAVGRVVDERDQPIAGATVRLLQRAEQGSSRRLQFLLAGDGEVAEGDLLTDADGRFTTDDLTVGSYDLEAKAPGYAPASAPGLEIPQDATEIDLGVLVLGPAAAILGRVVDPQGNPVAEAAIRSRTEGQGISPRFVTMLLEREAPKVRSQQDGSFKIEDQRPGDRIHLLVSKEGYVSAALAGVSAPTEQPVEVVLRLGSRVLGRVVDSSGAPVPQAVVLVFSESQGAASRRGMGKNSMTDDEGRFEVSSVEPGLATVMVNAQGYQRQQLGGLEVPPQGALEGVEFTLRRGATVRGQVTDSQRQAVVGATVMIGTGTSIGDNEGIVQSDGEGRFELTGVSPGPKVVSASDEGGRRATVHLEVDKEEHTVELMFNEGTEVSGQVRDANGLPLAGARVLLHPATRSFVFGMGELAATSDSGGGFRIVDVPSGLYSTRATKAGYSAHRSRDPFEVATTPVTGLDIILGEGATLSGQIRGLEYDDLVRVEVALRGSGVSSVRPDFEGRYRFINVPVGTWTVQAELDGGGRQARAEITVEEGVSELTLDLEFGGGHLLTGTVRQGEEPLAGVMILLSGKGVSWSGRTMTVHDGTFSFDGILKGTYDLQVRGLGSGLSHRREVEIYGDEDLLIDLAAGRLAGLVRDATTSLPVEGAEIVLESSSGEGSRSFGGRARSDLQGFFSLGQVVEGSWKITATKAGYAPAHLMVEVAPETDRRDLELVLEPTERLRFEVVTARGVAPGSITLAVLDAAGGRIMGGFFETTQQGGVEITTAPKGSWEMLLQAEGAGVLAVQASVPGDLGRLVLPEAGRLVLQVADLAEEGGARVRLTDADGRPYRRLSWGGDPETEFTLRRGSLTLDNLTQGSWQVTVLAQDGRSWSATVAVAAGSTATVELP